MRHNSKKITRELLGEMPELKNSEKMEDTVEFLKKMSPNISPNKAFKKVLREKVLLIADYQQKQSIKRFFHFFIPVFSFGFVAFGIYFFFGDGNLYDEKPSIQTQIIQQVPMVEESGIQEIQEASIDVREDEKENSKFSIIKPNDQQEDSHEPAMMKSLGYNEIQQRVQETDGEQENQINSMSIEYEGQEDVTDNSLLELIGEGSPVIEILSDESFFGEIFDMESQGVRNMKDTGVEQEESEYNDGIDEPIANFKEYCELIQGEITIEDNMKYCNLEERKTKCSEELFKKEETCIFD